MKVETPTLGKIQFHEYEILNDKKQLEEYRARVGMVFQSFNLFNNMTVLKNCTIALRRVLHMDKQTAQKQAFKYLKKVGMAAYVNAKPPQLSGGQNSVLPLQGLWQWSRRCCCLMNRPVP